ncbi:MAG TPA: sigma-54 dependent transcriptional regulator [Polyangiales bacterium]|nr:sigma-54 dependent transcriptional regulator [Polyangiales bacterium]
MPPSPTGPALRKVLVVDDEENIRLVLRTLLGKKGYEVEVAETAEAALERVAKQRPDFVLADVKMPGMSGIELCRELREKHPEITVIMMSAYGSVELALEAVRVGAYDYVAKPFKQDEVLFALAKAEEHETLVRENRALREAQGGELPELLGKSAAIQHVIKLIGKVAEYRTTVLIQGESGTGKELVARALHRRGPRADKPFVAVNCGAIPATLMESELFGHKRGAFTDAHADKIGIFQEASGGTLFLDEIGELTLPLQVKLLRVLQEGSVRPVGATKDLQVDVRLIAATVRDLQKEVAEGRFREDLYYRLNVLQIVVPPLRDRADDISLFIDHFIARNNVRLGTNIRGIDPAAKKLLLSYPWPGNVRELENLIERAVVLADGELLRVEDIPERVHKPEDAIAQVLASGELSIKKASRVIEESLIKRALEKTRGNRTAAARLLEISHRALLYKIKDYGLS